MNNVETDKMRVDDSHDFDSTDRERSLNDDHIKNSRLTFGWGSNPFLRTFRHSDQYIYTFVLISSLISLIASFILSMHAITLAGNKNASFSCNINAVISCGTVGASWQASAFGFPNAFIGLMFEPIICILSVLALCKVKIPRSLMVVVNIIYGFAVIFALWLFYQSIVYIHALCPYCLLVTLGTGLVFLNLLHANIRDNAFKLKGKALSLAYDCIEFYGDVFLQILYVVSILTIVIYKYGDYIF